MRDHRLSPSPRHGSNDELVVAKLTKIVRGRNNYPHQEPCQHATTADYLVIAKLRNDVDQPLEVEIQLQNSSYSRLWPSAFPRDWQMSPLPRARHWRHSSAAQKHLRSDSSKLGTFFQIGFNWTQLHAGISFLIMENTACSLPHLETGWFPATRKFLGSADASIHIPTTVLPRLLRDKDCILMDDLLANVFKDDTVTKINLCCLYLQLKSLAEIWDTSIRQPALSTAHAGEAISQSRRATSSGRHRQSHTSHYGCYGDAFSNSHTLN